MGRLAECEEPVLFARYGEVDKCEFIQVNAPEDAWEAWSSTDDGAGLLVKTGGLREQAREVLVSAVRSITSHSQPRALTLHSAVTARASTRIVVALQYMQMVALPTLLTGARLAACGEKEA